MPSQQPGKSTANPLPTELRGAYVCPQEMEWEEWELPFPDADCKEEMVANVIHKLGL